MLGNQMPEQMASHWNAAGQVDGYSNKNTALFLVPGMELGLVVLLLGVPHDRSPQREYPEVSPAL